MNCDFCTNQISCQQCHSGYYLDTNTGFCLLPASCPVGTYPNSQITPNQCSACSVANCYSCTSGGQCTQCASTYYLYNQSSCHLSNACPEKTYPDGSQTIKICASCSANCKRCSSPSTCTECLSNFYLSNSACVAPENCPTGTYPDDTVSPSNCSQCNLPNCVNCSSETVCTWCVEPYFVNSGACVTVNNCPARTFPNLNVQPNECSPCPENCEQCSSTTQCQICISGAYIYQSKCHLNGQCPPGTY